MSLQSDYLVPVYVWPDGSKVSLLSARAFVVDILNEEGFLLDLNDLSSSVSFVPASLQRKMSGFVFDLLGFHRRDVENVSPVYNELNAFGDGSLWIAPYPWFVPESVWGSICGARAGEIIDFGDFGVQALPLKGEKPRRGYEFNIYDFKSVVLLFSGRGNTLREASDKALGKALILPESKMESWEAESIERGRFVLPTPEEVEVYRSLGEPLPWCWPEEDRKKWIEDLGILTP